MRYTHGSARPSGIRPFQSSEPRATVERGAAHRTEALSPATTAGLHGGRACHSRAEALQMSSTIHGRKVFFCGREGVFVCLVGCPAYVELLGLARQPFQRLPSHIEAMELLGRLVFGIRQTCERNSTTLSSGVWRVSHSPWSPCTWKTDGLVTCSPDTGRELAKLCNKVAGGLHGGNHTALFLSLPV